MITVAGYFGYGKFKDILSKAKSARDEAANHAKRAADDAKEVADCAQKVRDALKSIETAAEKAAENLERSEHFADEVQARARDLQSIEITGEVSQEQKQALDEVASHLDVVEALGLPLDPESYLARGNDYYDKGDYERAAQCYEKATQLRPQFRVAWSNWGAALLEQAKTKQGEEAASLFQQAGEKLEVALGLEPDSAHAYFNRACLHCLLGRSEQALTDLRKAIELDPSNREDAKTDPDFKSLHSDTDFRNLVGLDPNTPEQDQP